MMTDESDGRAMGYSERVDAALRLAAAAHYQDMRKGTQIPYVMHPFHVGLILSRHGFDEDVMIAGILHDVLEDPRYEDAVVQERLLAVCPQLGFHPASRGAGFKQAVVAHILDVFGERVLDLVEHVTEQKTDGDGRKRPWKVRKEGQLAALADAPRDLCALKAADCLHNLRSMTRDLRRSGPDSLTRFKGGPEGSWWFYSSVVERVSPGLGPGHALANELADALGSFRLALDEC
jgi:(p)ppGpp synthase/HD superfamily hydrolase